MGRERPEGNHPRRATNRNGGQEDRPRRVPEEAGAPSAQGKAEPAEEGQSAPDDGSEHHDQNAEGQGLPDRGPPPHAAHEGGRPDHREPDRCEEGLDQAALPALEPRGYAGPGRSVLKSFGGQEDHPIHVEVGPALPAFEVARFQVPLVSPSEVGLLTMRAAEADRFGNELEIAGTKGRSALRTLTRLDVPERIAASLATHQR